MTRGDPIQHLPPQRDNDDDGSLWRQEGKVAAASNMEISSSTQPVRVIVTAASVLGPDEITNIVDVDSMDEIILVEQLISSSLSKQQAHRDDHDEDAQDYPETNQVLVQEDDHSVADSIDVDAVELGLCTLQINNSNRDEIWVVKSTLKSIRWSNFLMPRSPGEISEPEETTNNDKVDLCTVREAAADPPTTCTADSVSCPPLLHSLTNTTPMTSCTLDDPDDDRHDLVFVHPSRWSKVARPLEDDDDRHRHHSGGGPFDYLCFCHTMSHRYRFVFLTLLFCSLLMAMLLIVWEMLLVSTRDDEEDSEPLDDNHYNVSILLRDLHGNLSLQTRVILYHDPLAPPSLAMNWMLHDPYLATYGPSVVQRFAMATLLLSLGSVRFSNNNHTNITATTINGTSIRNQTNATATNSSTRITTDRAPGPLPISTELYGDLASAHGVSECSWNVLQFPCNENGKVMAILLEDMQLDGTLPVELGLLTWLRVIDVSHNSLSGTIPSTLGDLSSLQFLNLHHNQLSGSLPFRVGNDLQQLLRLHLAHNQLTGSIPESLGRLKQLKELYLQGNAFTGSVPESVCVLENAFDGDGSVANGRNHPLSPRRGSLQTIAIDCPLVACNCSCTCASDFGGGFR